MKEWISMAKKRAEIFSLASNCLQFTLGQVDLGDFDQAIKREWLLTNGLGGLASSTVIGANTRRYHGLLVAALTPPGGRTLLVSHLDEEAQYLGNQYSVSTHEFADGSISPQGYRYIERFTLEQGLPVWRFSLSDAILEKRMVMLHGSNTTFVCFSLLRASAPLHLVLKPFCSYRDYHNHHRGQANYLVLPLDHGFELTAWESAIPYRVICQGGKFFHEEVWYWNFKHRAEINRGLNDCEDLFCPGYFEAELNLGEVITVICSTEQASLKAFHDPWSREHSRQGSLLSHLPRQTPDWITQLALAGDQFIVNRKTIGDRKHGKKSAAPAILAGYPWFLDWGRDTFISLPGLLLTTKRFEEAALIFKAYATFLRDGILPNCFHEDGQGAEYNTVDASLWYMNALYQYFLNSKDLALIKDLFPEVLGIVESYEKGTRYQIHVDHADGLLFAGEPGVQVTWMDAKVGDLVFTPRIGKPVEINALWYNALKITEVFACKLRKPKIGISFAKKAVHTKKHFLRKFWFEEGGYLFDVVESLAVNNAVAGVPEDQRRNDLSFRPNQILAVGLPFRLLSQAQERSIINLCAKRLFTPVGLRSLEITDTQYRGSYIGDQFARDQSYHQGTVWAWLIGSFVTGHLRAFRDVALAKSYLTGIETHLGEACLGSVSEIFDGDPPHFPQGCFAQAWSVAEVLRAWFICEGKYVFE